MKLDESRFLERSPFWDELGMVFRNRFVVIVLVFLATTLGAYVTLQFMTEKYESHTSILVKLGRENTEVPATVGNGGFISTGVRPEELNSEVQMFRSRKLVEQTVDALGPETFRFELPPPETFMETIKYYVKKTYRWIRSQGRAFLVWVNLKKELSDRENAILVIQESLSVQAEKDSDVLTATLRLPDAKLSAVVLELLVQNYVDTHVEVRKMANVDGFFEEQLADLEARLGEMDAEEERLLKEQKLSDAGQQRSLLLGRLSEAEARADVNGAEKVMLLEQRAEIEERLRAIPEEHRSSEVRIRNPSRERIQSRLTELKLEREQLLNRYHPDSDPVTSIEEQIAGLEELLATQEVTHFDSVTTETHPIRQDLNHRWEEVNVRLAGLNAESKELEQRAAELRARLEELHSGEDRLNEILRERKVVEEKYHAYSKRMEDARISGELDERRVSNVAVVTPPTIPIEPVYPRKLLIMALSFPVGLMLGIGLALLLEYFNERIDSERDLRNIEGGEYLGAFDLSSPSLSTPSGSSE